jgi:hypothetical protein
MHQPETWGYVQFSTAPPGEAKFRADPAGAAKHLLHRIYYAQRDFHGRHQRYAATLSDLGLGNLGHESLASPLRMEATANGFQATADVRLEGDKLASWHIREDSRVWRQEPNATGAALKP